MKKALIISIVALFFLTACGNKNTLSAVAENGGYIALNDGAPSLHLNKDVSKGGVVKLSAKPSEGYAFDKWVCDSFTVFTTKDIEVAVNGNMVCSAKFNYIGAESHTINIGVEGQGEVYINGQARTSLVIKSGDEAFLAAEASAQHHFVKWTCDNDYNTSKISLTMNKDYNCTAHFQKDEEEVKHQVSLSSSDGGSVYLNGTNVLTAEYKENERVTALAVPSEGYEFLKWECGETQYNDAQISLQVNKPISCTPSFKVSEGKSSIKIYENGELKKSHVVLKGVTYKQQINNVEELNYYEINGVRYDSKELSFEVTESEYVINIYYRSHNSVTLGEGTHGSAQIIDGSLNSLVGSKYVLKPISDPGYYFLKWEVKRQKGIQYVTASYPTFIYEDVIPEVNEYDQVTITPIFTNDSSLIVPLNVSVDIENNVDMEIVYNNYYTKGQFGFSYYVNTKGNAVEYYTSTTCLSGTVSLNQKRAGKYVNVLRAVSSISEDVTDINIKFYDKTNKALISVIPMFEQQILKDTHYEISDIGESFKVEVPYMTLSKENESYYFVGFEDKDGNLINRTSFDAVYYEDVILIARYQKGIKSDDNKLVFYLKGDQYEVALNMSDDNFYNYGDVIIPSSFQGKPVTSIAPYGFANIMNGINSITIPESITNFGEYAFKNSHITLTTIQGDKDIDFSIFYSEKNYGNKYNITDNTLKNLLQNEYERLFTNTTNPITISFVDQAHLGPGVQGHYEAGSNILCVLDSGSLYDQMTFVTIVHEFRHYYQAVAIGQVHGLSISDLKVVPTVNEIGAWKVLEYTASDENLEKYYHNAREIDAREYATKRLGYYPAHECE